LQEAAIPPWMRESLPYLWCGDQLAWVAGLGADCHFTCAADEPGLEVNWCN
jgi:tRNA(Ile)-lysidine synthase